MKIGDNAIGGVLTPKKNQLTVLQIDTKKFFTVHLINGFLTVSLKLTDHLGNILLLINEGQLQTTTNIYDFQYEGDTIKIHSQKREIILEMKLSDTYIEIIRGKFMHENGRGFIVEKENSHSIFKSLPNNNILSGCPVYNLDIAFFSGDTKILNNNQRVGFAI